MIEYSMTKLRGKRFAPGVGTIFGCTRGSIRFMGSIITLDALNARIVQRSLKNRRLFTVVGVKCFAIGASTIYFSTNLLPTRPSLKTICFKYRDMEWFSRRWEANDCRFFSKGF